MHKLTNVEAQRVMAVLGETLDRLDYLSYVTTDVDFGLVEQLEEENCSDVANILQRQWQLEEAHAMGNGTSTNEICGNTRSLCRSLRTNPVAVETVYRSSTQHRSSSFLACVKALKELTDVTLRKMSTTVEDASSQTNLLHDVTEREKGAEEDRATLQAQLNMERKEKERDIAQLDMKRTKLMKELQEITENTKIQEKEIEQEQKERMDKANTEHSALTTALTEQVVKLEEQIKTVREANKTNEAALRKKMNKSLAEVQSAVQKYDNDMGEREAKSIELQKKYEEEKVMLQALEEHFNKVDAENARIAEEDRIINEIQARENAAKKVLDDAAAMVQKHIRGFLSRREFKKLLKASKKKGKKKKKK
jgi:hypothetical protein